MFAFNDILQKIEQEITGSNSPIRPKSLYDPIECTYFHSVEKNPSGTRTDGM